MCSDPRQTTNEHGEEITYACRVCDECIATRKNDWVARGMAEMDTAAHTYVLNLTYRNNPDGSKPVAARAFRYKDVQNLLKRLRAAAARKYGKGVEIRYIVCGERGSQKDRVHWHMVLYSSHDLYDLGKWYDFYFKLIGQPRPKRMDHWSMWDHGHIVTDEVDQKSISYILKYCIKDQFNVVKSKGTARYARSENHGASMFRMSKAPPIGWRYVEQKIERLKAARNVPPTVDINVPRYSGFWWPRAVIRENYLIALRDINHQHREETGRDAPSWKTLIASLSENEKDLELLNVITTQEEIETPEQFEARLDEQQRAASKRYASAQTRRRCGNVKPCENCLNSLSDAERTEYEQWRLVQAQTWREDYIASDENHQKRFARENRPNPFCQYREDVEKYFTIGAKL